jgi:photosynthetic reaction center cytochrome c subunit
MKRALGVGRTASLCLLLGGAALLAGCERPPAKSTQQGYRGTGMVQIDNPRIKAAQEAARPPIPATTPPAPTEGPKAREVFQNVKVLGDLSVAEFTRHMASITAWVAPQEGCAYCHNLANLADDGKYQKVVARRMIEMTQHINADWDKHVAKTGVTCYTCHRGNAVPAQVWYKPATPARNRPDVLLGNDFGQNKAVPSIGRTSLPYDPFSDYLLGKEPIRVAGPAALPTAGYKMPIQSAEKTYALMMHMSEALGVNCTFCHNTRSFQAWDGPPQRATAWHGIQMARDLNTAYLTPLTGSFPKERLGPTGDVAKVYCATCHQGQNKPLGGNPMASQYIGLVALAPPAPPPLPAPVDEPTKSVLYFGVGSSALEGAQAKGMAQLVVTMTNNAKTVATISGYHSAAGTLAANQELAKQRAFAVRDALLAAGIAEARVKLEKPRQTEANIAGEDPVARRVEVTVR